MGIVQRKTRVMGWSFFNRQPPNGGPSSYHSEDRWVEQIGIHVAEASEHLVFVADVPIKPDIRCISSKVCRPTAHPIQVRTALVRQRQQIQEVGGNRVNPVWTDNV